MAITIVTRIGIGRLGWGLPDLYVHILGCVEVEHACLYGDCWIVQVFTYVYMIHGDKRCG